MAALIDYSKFTEHAPPKKKKYGRFLLFLLVIVLFFSFGGKSFQHSKENTPPLPDRSVKAAAEKKATYFTPDKKSSEIEEIVQKELAGTLGDYAVAIKHLKTGESYFYNEHKIFESASLYKLFVMATVFQKIQNGNLSQNDIVSQKIPILNKKFRISSESAELKEGDITLPINSALTRMITVSDNYSALLLAEKVKLSQIASFLEQTGLTESRVGTKGESPATSVHDMTIFFQKLYNNELATKALSQEMLMLLKNQRLNGKLPKYLPTGTIVSHKTGELGRLSHDAGIVYTQKGDYIIVILTETSDPQAANERIGQISKSVYEYFISR